MTCISFIWWFLNITRNVNVLKNVYSECKNTVVYNIMIVVCQYCNWNQINCTALPMGGTMHWCGSGPAVMCWCFPGFLLARSLIAGPGSLWQLWCGSGRHWCFQGFLLARFLILQEAWQGSVKFLWCCWRERACWIANDYATLKKRPNLYSDNWHFWNIYAYYVLKMHLSHCGTLCSVLYSLMNLLNCNQSDNMQLDWHICIFYSTNIVLVMETYNVHGKMLVSHQFLLHHLCNTLTVT